jgi:hypothetical protein
MIYFFNKKLAETQYFVYLFYVGFLNCTLANVLLYK